MLSCKQSNRFATMNLSTRQSMLMGIWHGMVVQFPAISSLSNGKFSSFVGVRDCRLDTWGRFLGFPDNDPGREVELVGTRATRCYNTTNPWFPVLPKKPWTCLQTTNTLFVGIEIFLQNKRQKRNFSLFPALEALRAISGLSSWTLLAQDCHAVFHLLSWNKL